MTPRWPCQVDGQPRGDTWQSPPGKAMVTLTVRDGQRVDLTAEQIKKMTWPQHAKVWKVRARRSFGKFRELRHWRLTQRQHRAHCVRNIGHKFIHAVAADQRICANLTLPSMVHFES